MRGTSAGMMLVVGASVVRKWLVAPESRMAHRLMVVALVVIFLRRTEATSTLLWVGAGQQVVLIELFYLPLPAPTCQKYPGCCWLGACWGCWLGGVVGCHHGHRLLSWLLHHLRIRGIWCWVLLSDKIHHALARLLRQHGHGHACTVRRLCRAQDRVV
jgi:hypothetical protein